jgi:hypothetical protein
LIDANGVDRYNSDIKLRQLAMTHLRIDFDGGDGQGWRPRAEGEIADDTSVDVIKAQLAGYAIQYPHRAYVNGVLVAEHAGMRRRRAA